MADDMLLGAAGQIADGADVDWALTSSTLSSVEDREVAEELAVVARIARSHRELHDLLPVAPDTPPQLMPDRTRWGHLDLLNIVGRGSYGTVYRAWDTRLERLVALKLFHGASDPNVVMREGRMLARVRHENVVTVYGADIIDGVAGLWMELVHGRTLDQIVRADGPMDVRQAASIGADVAKALAAVHNAGLLHCDVKAQNVVCENTGRVVLMDLGAGQPMPEAADDTQLSDVAGTPRYMAPELFHAGAKATRATDAYSFGVLLYYLVSALYPVDGKSVGELRQAHLDGRVRPLDRAREGLPSGYVALVTRALDRDPSKRPESAVEIQEALKKISTPPPSPSLLKSIGLLAAVAVGVGLVVTFVVRPSQTPAAPPASPARSIAVLPIRNLTGDASKAYIADGLTEVLISNLARVPTLRVPSFAAVAPFRDSTQGPGELANRLGVQLLVAGSIAEANGEIRLAIHLSDVKGTAVWGDEVTRDVAGVMSAQSDLSRRLAQQLALAPGAIPVRKEFQARAEDAYLRGLALRVSSPTAQLDAARAFREAVELEPGFADAWAQLSLIETAFGERRLGRDRDQSRLLAKEMADRALAIDPQLPNGLAAIGTIQFYMDWDYPAAERSFRQAITASPSAAFTLQRFSMLLSSLKRFDEAVDVARESQRIEPGVAIRSTTLGTVYYYARRFDLAEKEMRRALSVTPDFGTAHFGLGRIAAARGDTDVAIAEIQKALAQGRNSSWLVELARTYAQAGQKDNLNQVMNELTDRERAGDRFSVDNLGYIAVAEGRFDDAFKYLQQGLDEKNSAMLWLAVDPRVDAIRKDPRFTSILRTMKLQP